MSTVLYDLADGILTLTLNRPDRLNAYNAQLHDELIAALRRADTDDAVRAIVVTGSGRGFCAGADLGAAGDTFRRDGNANPSTYRDGGGMLSLEIFRLRKPILAAINGPAVGVGITMTLPMDIRVASSAAKMGFVFTRRGMVPEACSSFFLPRIVGISRASEWVLTGRVFSAQEALEGGLVSRVVPPEELLPTVHGIAREIRDNTSPVSVALSRQMLWRQLGSSSPMRGHRIESLGIYHRGRSRDVVEGVESFLEKRPPRFPERVSTDMPDYFPWWEEEGF
ncbi:MAG TPA: crotonase/enoyl-CoA hydratase family protein [Thermoanaerobaculia bacterium]|nr:crotonase/enoyl-CoA hydratase family protein [Thermoanaerobaculia bacterium]